jgi:hypothetical protein
MVCLDCKQEPKRNRFDARWQCACEGKVWPPMRGQRGDVEEHAKLTDAGFQMTSDTIGDSYYVGPHAHIVWLFEDRTWKAYPDSQYDSLDRYLEYIKSSVTAF